MASPDKPVEFARLQVRHTLESSFLRHLWGIRGALVSGLQMPRGPLSVQKAATPTHTRASDLPVRTNEAPADHTADTTPGVQNIVPVLQSRHAQLLQRGQSSLRRLLSLNSLTALVLFLTVPATKIRCQGNDSAIHFDGAQHYITHFYYHKPTKSRYSLRLERGLEPQEAHDGSLLIAHYIAAIRYLLAYRFSL